MNKRFDYEDEYITLDGGVFAEVKTVNDAELISKTLNQLLDDIDELKQQNKEENKQLKEENVKLNNHINSIIQLLEGVIQANNYEIEWSERNNKDCSCIKYINEEFEKIKTRVKRI